MNIEELTLKKERLRSILGRFTRLGVAFSGGVDSSLLLAVARQILGDGVTALTADSPIHPAGDTALAKQIAHRLGVHQMIVRGDEMQDPEFLRNSPERCYWCKKRLIAVMRAQTAGIGITALVHGANLDDLSDFRPGLNAAREAGVTAPLMEARLTKSEIRAWARELGLPNWDRPAGACLATRIPYGSPIDTASLERIERAEALIRSLGIASCRVRHFGTLASIETDGAEIAQLAMPALRSRIVDGLRAIGYAQVSLDLEGYVSGKMNRVRGG